MGFEVRLGLTEGAALLLLLPLLGVVEPGEDEKEVECVESSAAIAGVDAGAVAAVERQTLSAGEGADILGEIHRGGRGTQQRERVRKAFVPALAVVWTPRYRKARTTTFLRP